MVIGRSGVRSKELGVMESRPGEKQNRRLLLPLRGIAKTYI